MAHKKSGGSIAPNRDSQGKRRGVKIYGGESVDPGKIIIRQCGTKYFPGKGVGMGRDYTIFAVKTGVVKFTKRQGRSLVNVVSG